MNKKTDSGKSYNTKWFVGAFLLFLFVSIAISIWIFTEPTSKIDPHASGITKVGSTDAIIIPLSADERAYLENLGPIRFAVNPDWEPFENIANGNHKGIAADLFTLVTQRLGLTTELVITRNWQESLEAGRDGSVHILPFLNQTQEREEWLLFTEPYFTDATAIITHDDHDYITDLATLEGKTVVLPAGSRFEEQIRSDYPNLDILLVKRVNDMLGVVEKGEADFALHSLTIADYTIRKANISNLKIAGVVPHYESKFRIGIVKQEPILHAILNKGIASITAQDVQQIKNKHLSITPDAALSKRMTIGLAIILSVLIGIGLAWIHVLRKMNRYLSMQESALKDSQTMLAYIIEHDTSAVAVLDLQLRFIYVSQKFSNLFQLNENLIGRHYQDVHTLTPDLFKGGFQEALLGKATQESEDLYTREDGLAIWIQWVMRPWFLADNSVGGLVFYVEDITERRDAKIELQASEEKFRLITEHSSDVIWILDIASLKFTYISPAIEQLRGYTVEEALQQSLETSLTAGSYRVVQKTFAGKLEEFRKNPHNPKVHYIELQQPCKDGFIIWVEISVKYRMNNKGEVEAVGVTRNIEERKKAEARIRYLSYYDQLTSLYNRRYYEEQLPKLDVAENYPLTLVMADVNGLKSVNDNLGHQIGDQLLIAVAKTINRRIRVYDMAARIGGDEYVILMPRTDSEVASELITALESSLRKTSVDSLHVSVALGWATKESADVAISDVFKQAEDMMYKRKKREQTSRIFNTQNNN